MPALAVPATINSHQILVFLLQVAVLLGIAILLGRVAARFGMPALVGELTTGVLLGPSVLAHAAPGISRWLLPDDASQLHLLDAVGQIGVLLLVGIAGMSIDLGLIGRRRAAIGLVGGGGLLVPLGLGIALGFVVPAALLGPSAHQSVFALFLGVAMGVSALPVIAKTLLEMNLLHMRVGQMIMGASAVDDCAGWMLLSLVALMVHGGVTIGDIGLSMVRLTVVLAAVAFVARPVARGLLTLANRSTEPGVLAGVIVVLLILAGAATQALGMEAILGTFLCGLVLSSSKLVSSEQIAGVKAFVMAVLAPLYFATAGLRMDLTALRHPVTLGFAAAILAVAVGGKFGGAYLGARAAGIRRWESYALGAGLNARGVVEVVVARTGLSLGVLSPATYTIVILVALATSLMAPPLLRHAVRRGAAAGEMPHVGTHTAQLDSSPVPSTGVGSTAIIAHENRG